MQNVDVRAMLRGSDLFYEQPPQGKGNTCFRIQGIPGASIYARNCNTQIHIYRQVLEAGKFPNNERLRELAVRHDLSKSKDKAVIGGEHVGQIISMIRDGLAAR